MEDRVVHNVRHGRNKHLADGLLAAAEANLYLCQTKQYATILSIIFTNIHTSAVTMRIYAKPSGGTSRQIVTQDKSLAAGECYQFEVPVCLSPAGAIRGYASVADKISYYISGNEEI